MGGLWGCWESGAHGCCEVTAHTRVSHHTPAAPTSPSQRKRVKEQAPLTLLFHCPLKVTQMPHGHEALFLALRINTETGLLSVRGWLGMGQPLVATQQTDPTNSPRRKTAQWGQGPLHVHGGHVEALEDTANKSLIHSCWKSICSCGSWSCHVKWSWLCLWHCFRNTSHLSI